MPVDAKDFAEWFDLPMTQYVMAAMQALAEREMQAWQGHAWEGNLDPLALHTARARVEVSNTFTGNTFDDWKAINDPEA